MRKIVTRLAVLVIAALLPGAGIALPVSAFVGQPAIRAGVDQAVYAWQDEGKDLHLRVTSKNDGKPERFTGKVCVADGRKISSLSPVMLEQGDTAKVGPQERCVLFTLVNNGHIDGFDLKTPGRKVTFDVNSNGRRVSPAKVWIGSANAHPPRTPFHLTR